MSVPSFQISPGKEISDLFLARGVKNFPRACEYVKNLPYRRTSDKVNLPLVLTEERGTCSSKHAVLTALARENNNSDVKLMMGIFKMSGESVKGAAPILKKYEISYIPEAHNYLMYDGKRYDFTFPGLNDKKVFESLLEEIEIDVSKIGQYKTDYHKNFLMKWFNKNGAESSLTLKDILKIREECIESLSK